jgi:hypothetical protein
MCDRVAFWKRNLKVVSANPETDEDAFTWKLVLPRFIAFGDQEV